jgi:integrase
MKGWVRVNRGKKRNTYYVVVPWDAMDGSGRKKKWQFKFDKRGDRFDSKAHGDRFLEYLRTLIDEGTFNPLDWVEQKPHSLEELEKQYLQHYEEKVERGEISPSTLRVKKRYFKNYFRPYFAGRDMKYVVNLELAKFHSQLPQGLKAKTRVNIMSELNTFVEWAKSQGVIKGEVPRYTEMANLKRLAQEERPPVREQTHLMPDADFERAVAQMEASDRPIFRFIRHTGCRTSEARALQRSDFDWYNKVLEIRRTWVDAGKGEILVERAKSGSQRPLYITDELEAIVKSSAPRLDTPFVFSPGGGNFYTRRQVDYRWRTAIKKAGLPHMELKNATRASFICEMLRLGYSYEEIGAVVGHKHTETTKRYGKIFVEQTAGLLERRTKKTGTK